MFPRLRHIVFGALLGASLLPLVVVGSVSAAQQSAVTMPDLVVRVPRDAISIGIDPSTGDRMLHFSHITSDVGLGPFEIDPAYNASTGVARFSQAIYRSPSSGRWVFDHRSRVAAIGVFHPPSDYDFPLTSFTLLTTSGAVVARSPKTDYCITGDYQLSGIPNTPPNTSPPQSNCADPTLPLGWSVGWGDEYDQTDNGQPIDLTKVPDGTYVLRGMVDPQHVLYESNYRNDITDTVLTIHGTSVTVGSQTHPRPALPSVAITAPTAGFQVGGTVTVTAGVSAPGSAGVQSVQFLLDGAPLGAPVTSAPYQIKWHTAGSSVGTHYLSARVTDTRGLMNTARPVRVRVVPRLGSLVLDRNIARTATTSVTTRKFSTTRRGDLLLAFAGADGPQGQRVAVSGAGLSWARLRRANREPGDAEIWQAHVTGRLRHATVTARAAVPGYHVRLNVVALSGATGTGATVARSSASAAPHASYAATKANSVGFAVGDDYDRATSPAPDQGQVLVNSFLDTGTGDTYWTQASTSGAKAAGVTVTLGDTAPTGDHTNFAAIEVLAKTAGRTSAAPAITFLNPTGREFLSGTVPVAAQVTGPAPIHAVTFRVDGRLLHKPVTAAPFATRWDTAVVADGRHVLSARVVDDAGGVSTTRRVVRVRNPAPPMTCFVVQQDVSSSGRGSVLTKPLHTAVAREVLLAVISANGPIGQKVHVHGAGLRWRLLGRADARAGDAEVWEAVVPRVRRGVRVHAVPEIGGYRQLVTVVALEGASHAGAVTARSGRAGTAKAPVRITGRTASLVFAVGTSRERRPTAAAPGLPVGQIFAGRRRSPGSLLWSQYTNDSSTSAGSLVRMRAHVAGAWNFVAVEVVGDDS